MSSKYKRKRDAAKRTSKNDTTQKKYTNPVFQSTKKSSDDKKERTPPGKEEKKLPQWTWQERIELCNSDKNRHTATLASEIALAVAIEITESLRKEDSCVGPEFIFHVLGADVIPSFFNTPWMEYQDNPIYKDDAIVIWVGGGKFKPVYDLTDKQIGLKQMMLYRYRDELQDRLADLVEKEVSIYYADSTFKSSSNFFTTTPPNSHRSDVRVEN